MKEAMRRLLFLALLLVSIPAVVTAAQVLNFGNGDEPKDLDPHIVTGVPEFHILMNLFEGLVQKDPKTLKPLPGVAESWKVSKDGKTYTFKLRKNAKWTDGHPVTAQDFIYSWTRLLTPATASEYSYQGYYIKNGKDFNLGKLKDASKLGLKAPDPYTLVVELENPTPFFISLLFHHSLLPVPRWAIEKWGPQWTKPEHMVSNGAFALEKWELNRIITLKKNETYWDKDKVKLDTVNFYPVQLAEVEDKMFRSGELDVTNEVALEKIPGWQKDKSGVFISSPWLGTYYYWFNITRKPLDNPLVRKALTLAIDREKIVKYVTRANEIPGTVFVPPGAGGYQPTPRLPKDASQVKKAQELLAKAGFPGGRGMPTIEILYNTLENHKKIAEAIQQMWHENLGINATLFNQEWKAYLDNEQSKNYMVARAGWIADYNDPNTFLDTLKSDSGTNYSGWSNPKYDALINAAAKEKNSKKRFQDFHGAEDILLEELPVMPIFIYTRNYLLSKKIQGWYPNIEDIHPLKFVSMKP